MISPKNMGIIEIDITNACVHSCSNCTRFCGHHEKTYFMDVDFFKRAVDSLEDYEGQIGFIGGEPTLHPQFEELVDYVRKNRTKKTCKHSLGPISDMQFHIDSTVNHNNNTKTVLLSSLSKGYYDHFEVINDTFEHQILNDHGSESLHQALLISRKELGIPDDEWIKKRDNCWIQNTWSASITPKGAFFCEVAGALDMLFKGPGGWNIEPGWWKREPADFADQLSWCEICSACLDAPKRLAHDERDDVSPALFEKLKAVNSPKVKSGRVVIREPRDYDSYKSEAYITGSEYIEAGAGIRITQENRNLFPRKIEVISEENEIKVDKKHGDWYVWSTSSLNKDKEKFILEKIWNPGCLYIIDDEELLFHKNAKSIRDIDATKITRDLLLASYPNYKIVYVYRNDPLLFLLGGQTKEEKEKYDRRGKHLLVYGAGGIGKKVVERLDEHGFTDYDIVVTDINKTEKIDGHTISNISDFSRNADDMLVVLATEYPLHKELISILEKYGFENYCTLA